MPNHTPDVSWRRGIGGPAIHLVELSSHKEPVEHVGFIAPCLPPSARQPPRGLEWPIEIKHDGFRVIARKQGKRVRLYSRPGNDLMRSCP